MLKHLLAALPLALLLTACADPVQDATDEITARMNPKGTSEVNDTRLYPSGVVCGAYQVLDRWGEGGGKLRFVYYNEELTLHPSRGDISVYCSENPQEVVEQKFGIPLAGEAAAQTARVVAELNSLADALDRYYDDNGNYPTTEQGLAALTNRPETALPMNNYLEGGYLNEIPEDPWMRAYVYEGPVWGRVRSPYSLWSYGADGKPGGSGADADIGSDNLKYLVFAASL